MQKNNLIEAVRGRFTSMLKALLLVMCFSLMSQGRLAASTERAIYDALRSKVTNAKNNADNWRVRKEVSLMDDSDTVVYRLESSPGDQPEVKRGALVIGHVEGELIVYVELKGFLVILDLDCVRISTRFDNAPACSYTFNRGRAGDTAHIREKISFLTKVAASHKVVIKVRTMLDSSYRLLIFDLKGSAWAIHEVLEAYGRKRGYLR